MNRFKKHDLRIRRVGFREPIWNDMYHRLMRITWPRFFGVLLLCYIVINCLFSTFYFLVSDGIAHIEHGDFFSCFMFSVQTLSTVGFGYLYPTSTAANVLVTLEAATGLFFSAAVTGLVFAKFARPSSRVVFSENMLYTHQNGKPYLTLRMGNFRANQVYEGRARMTLLRDQVSEEGEKIRRLTDLSLVRNETPVFALSWTLMHPIAPHSPFFEVSEQQKIDENWEVVITFSGLDQDTAQTIAATTTYRLKQIVRGRKFVDMIELQKNGIRTIDFSKIHLIE